MSRPFDPQQHAEQLGLRVEYAGIASHGLWLPDRALILLQPGLKVIQERCILAHELGHAELGHRDDRPRHEAAADRWAAEHLVDPARLRDLMRWVPDAARWSLELGVTTKILGVYLERHRRELRAAA